jgi:aspartyl protease family protein
MSNPTGPWGHQKRRSFAREPLVWVAVVLALALGLWKLSTLYPDALSNQWSRLSLIQWLGWLVLLAAAIVNGRRFGARETARNIAIWLAIVGVLALGYAYRDELTAVYGRLRGEIVPSYPAQTGAHEMTIDASEGGGFYVEGTVNGLPTRFLIDTGATDIVLSPEDAKRIGLDLASLNYFHDFESAHGVGHGAPATVARLAVGSFAITDVPVMVNQSAMSSSVLGLSFLQKFGSFEFRGHRLILRWGSGAATRSAPA